MDMLSHSAQGTTEAGLRAPRDAAGAAAPGGPAPPDRREREERGRAVAGQEGGPEVRCPDRIEGSCSNSVVITVAS